jgi:hypothetical protein
LGFQHTAKFKAGSIYLNLNLPANTGNDKSNNTAVTKIAHPNKGTLCKTCPGILILIIVVMTLH